MRILSHLYMLASLVRKRSYLLLMQNCLTYFSSGFQARELQFSSSIFGTGCGISLIISAAAELTTEGAFTCVLVMCSYSSWSFSISPKAISPALQRLNNWSSLKRRLIVMHCSRWSCFAGKLPQLKLGNNTHLMLDRIKLYGGQNRVVKLVAENSPPSKPTGQDINRWNSPLFFHTMDRRLWFDQVMSRRCKVSARVTGWAMTWQNPDGNTFGKYFSVQFKSTQAWPRDNEIQNSRAVNNTSRILRL